MASIRRGAALIAVLALCAGNLAVCAGWQPMPEARMACCTDGMTCPTHMSEDHEHASRQGVSQAQADSCCAAAQRRDSTAAGATFAASGVITLVPVAAFTAPVSALPSQQWRALVPLPASSTSRHLLLSVLLV